MIAISSRSQYAPPCSATCCAPSVYRTLRLIEWRYQLSLPVNCASSDLLRVFVVMMCLFRFKGPAWRGRERQQEQPHRRRGVTGNRGINEGQPVGNHRLCRESALTLACGCRSEEHTSELQSLRHLVCR